MKKITLTAPRVDDDPVVFDVYPTESLYKIFKTPGVRKFTTHEGIIIERKTD